MTAKIGIIIGSGTDFPLIRKGLECLHKMGMDFDMVVASAHRSPEKVKQWIGHCEKSGIEVIIAGAGGAAHLPGVVASHTLLPVIGLPLDTSTLGGRDALYSVVQMPPGIPVATVGVNSAENAVLLALHILAIKYADVRDKLAQFRSSMLGKIERQNADVVAEIARICRGEAGLTPAPAAQKKTPAEVAAAPGSDPSSLMRATAKAGAAGSTAAHRPAPARTPLLDYSLALRRAISLAQEIATAYGHDSVSVEHYLAAFLDLPGCRAHAALAQAGANLDSVAGELKAHFGPASGPSLQAVFAPDEMAVWTVAMAKTLAAEHVGECLTTVDVLQAIVSGEGSAAARALLAAHVTADSIAAIISEGRLPPEPMAAAAPRRQRPEEAPPPELDQAEVVRMQKRLFGVQVPPPPEPGESKAALGPTATARGPAFPAAKRQGGKAPAARKPRARKGAAPRTPAGLTEIAGEKVAKPRILVCDPLNPALGSMEDASDTVLDGGVVAFPTDTVYGVGVDATNPAAVARLFALKRREERKAIAVLIHTVNQLKHITPHIPDGVELLLDRFWPGPLTVVFERHPETLAGLSKEPTIGVRIPDHYLALALLSMVQRPMATSSANRSGEQPSLSARDVVRQFGDSLDLIIDGGEARGKVSSTVLSVAQRPFRVIRQGAIAVELIASVLGERVLG